MDLSTDGEIISDYESYVKSCLKNGVTYIAAPEDWPTPSPKLRFMPGVVAMGRDLLMRNKGKLANAAVQGPQALLKASVEVIKDEGISRVKSFVLNGGAGGKGNDGLPSPGNDNMGVKNSLLGDYTPLPMKVELKPGLVNRAYRSLVNDPTSRYATTHLLGIKLGLPTNDSTENYFNRVLVPNLQQKAQSTVNFKVDLNTLSAAKLTTYINDVTAALNICYFNTSLLSYASIPNNRDVGLLALRNMITANDIDFIQQLQQLLSSIPIPPNLNATCFFMNQNFSDSEFGDGIFKLMPISFNDTTNTDGVVTGFNGVDSAAINASLLALNTSNNREIASVLLRIAPGWMNPTIFDAPVIPVYSKLACTIFANSNHKYYNGSVQYTGPIVADIYQPISYLSFEDNIDGAALALSSHYVGSAAANVAIPSLASTASTRMTVGTTSFYCNRFSYVLRSSDDKLVWRESNRSIESAFGRLERTRAYLGTEYFAKLPGAVRYNGLTPDTLNESVKDMLSWLLSYDTIKSQKSGGKSWSNKNKEKDKPTSEGSSQAK